MTDTSIWHLRSSLTSCISLISSDIEGLHNDKHIFASLLMFFFSSQSNICKGFNLEVKSVK